LEVVLPGHLDVLIADLVGSEHVAAGLGLRPLLNHYWIYTVFRISLGDGSVACYIMAFTLSVDLVGKQEQLYGVSDAVLVAGPHWSLSVLAQVSLKSH